ncbi:hypothetical protein BKA65DRAFT_567305 [Rhexocercosporidium sp. MPI-PUGE-AT-0058]|nr:hypothetical protein BKA65DRAFT_567305 [Rhexocercosporidium sp. MPI-PUGE-AT-0058]
MASKSPATLADPRLNRAANYNRAEVVSEILSFYNFLPHIHPSSIYQAPPGGWEMITAENLAKHGVHKSDEAIALLRELPYLEGPEAWIQSLAFVCDWREVAKDPPWEPNWLGSDAKEEWTPAWVIQLTAGLDREAIRYYLDTTDGTVSCYQNWGFEYERSYSEDDPRSWRDRPCNPETWILKDLLDEWRDSYCEMKILGLPAPLGGYGSGSGRECEYDFGPGSHNHGLFKAVQAIYHEFGWPDSYRKVTCILGVQFWLHKWEDVNRSISRRTNGQSQAGPDDPWLSPEVFLESVKKAGTQDTIASNNSV